MPVGPRALQHVLVDDQPLQTDWPACMNPARADPDFRFRPETVPETVREARTCVDERSRRVHCLAKRGRRCRVLRHNAVRVVRRVRIDELHGRGERGHSCDGENEREVLRVVVCRSRRSSMRREVGRRRRESVKSGERQWVAQQAHARGEESGCHGGPHRVQHRFMHDEIFRRVARRRVVDL